MLLLLPSASASTSTTRSTSCELANCGLAFGFGFGFCFVVHLLLCLVFVFGALLCLLFSSSCLDIAYSCWLLVPDPMLCACASLCMVYLLDLQPSISRYLLSVICRLPVQTASRICQIPTTTSSWHVQSKQPGLGGRRRMLNCNSVFAISAAQELPA
jgi:hypothetical protein